MMNVCAGVSMFQELDVWVLPAGLAESKQSINMLAGMRKARELGHALPPAANISRYEVRQHYALRHLYLIPCFGVILESLF
jgi:hypothetical protein